MKLTDKIELIKQAHADTAGIEFGQRNLIIANIAKRLGLKSWIGDKTWDIAHPSRKQYLISLPQ
ncbi:hypothetical protein GBK02_09255 [Dechloromonas sp. TW-R-39-2]|uniref:hypothetical protein n=1 Tax=Dechloromonas sp. TW-R-39-2 TaxID=2654218 RepID=UPI00193D7A88|nr:hypothetical protein [Dechloromonas sp. TW-R-39-2]QRM19576.1 hypothetical protein GBK02_09255 [Dechloromonas sp. TW-R-39-2]